MVMKNIRIWIFPRLYFFDCVVESDRNVIFFMSYVIHRMFLFVISIRVHLYF